jgi:hypothetical protein
LPGRKAFFRFPKWEAFAAEQVAHPLPAACALQMTCSLSGQPVIRNSEIETQ